MRSARGPLPCRFGQSRISGRLPGCPLSPRPPPPLLLPPRPLLLPRPLPFQQPHAPPPPPVCPPPVSSSLFSSSLSSSSLFSRPSPSARQSARTTGTGTGTGRGSTPRASVRHRLSSRVLQCPAVGPPVSFSRLSSVLQCALQCPAACPPGSSSVPSADRGPCPPVCQRTCGAVARGALLVGHFLWGITCGAAARGASATAAADELRRGQLLEGQRWWGICGSLLVGHHWCILGLTCGAVARGAATPSSYLGGSCS